jgi:hypothetical protein
MGERTEVSGAIVDLDDGTRLEWGFNPEEFTDEDSTRYAKIYIPGMSHPRIQFTGGGERTLSFVLPLHYSRSDVPQDMRILRSWKYGEYSGGRLIKAPHRLLVQFGETWMEEKWLLEQCQFQIKRMDKQGKPLFTLASMRLIEYIDTSRGMREVRG